MTKPTVGDWRAFWMPFAAGWVLLVAMAATNSRMATAASPNGILDHQSARTGARANEIQQAWRDAGAFDFARLSIGTDLVYIGVLTLGVLVGCRLIAQRATGGALKGFALLVGLVWLAYGASDYAETIAQFIEVNTAGSDRLAGLAASMGPPKIATFLLGHLGLVCALIWLRLTRPKAALAV